MKTLYICHTVYQFLMVLLKYRTEDDNHILVIDGAISEQFLERATSFTIHRSNSNLYGLKGCLSFGKWKKEKYFFSTFDECYLFLDHRHVGAFFHANQLPYYLLEDGLNFFQYQGTDKRQRLYQSSVKEGMYNWLTKRPDGPGKSPYCLSIEVNENSGLQFRDERLQKVIEVPRRFLFDRLSEHQRLEIFKIFGVDKLSQPLQGILVLTQPLVQDNWDEAITTKDNQIEFYRQIVVNYGQNQRVFFKIHPRDNVDYSSLKEVIFLDQRLPMELYEMMADCRFSKGVTHSSTALDFLTCVDEKIILKAMK